jgi:adenine specific DNA methylase Mod
MAKKASGAKIPGGASVPASRSLQTAIKAYIDYRHPHRVQLASLLKRIGSFYYYCDWHASYYVKVLLDKIFRFLNLLKHDKCIHFNSF